MGRIYRQNAAAPTTEKKPSASSVGSLEDVGKIRSHEGRHRRLLNGNPLPEDLENEELP